MTDTTANATEEMVERICHQDQLTVWADELISGLGLGGYLQDHLEYSDTVDMSVMVQRQIRVMFRAAVDLHALSAAPSSPVTGGVVKVKPLDLSTLIQHAFLTGHGLKEFDKLSEADREAWVEYDPSHLKAYQRITNALSPTGTDELREENERLRAALEWAIADIEGRTKYDNDSQWENALQAARTAFNSEGR